MNGQLLALANKGASALEQLVGKPICKLVNVAGRQRSDAPESTAQTKEGLDQARNQWVFYDSALTLKAGECAALERGANVSASSENILSVMEKFTGMHVPAGA